MNWKNWNNWKSIAIVALTVTLLGASLLVTLAASASPTLSSGTQRTVQNGGTVTFTHHAYFPLVTRAEQPEQAIPLREGSGSIGSVGSFSEECYEDAISDSPSYLLWGYANEEGGSAVSRLLNSAADPPYCGVQRMYLEFDTSNVSTVDTAQLVLPVWKKDRYGYMWTDFTVHEGTWQAGTLTDDLYSTWTAWVSTPLVTETVTESVTKTISLDSNVVQPGGVTRLTIRSYPETEEPDFRAEVRFNNVKLFLSP